MKFLIYFLTFFICTFININIGYITGFRLGAVLLYIVEYHIARRVYRNYKLRKEEKLQKTTKVEKQSYCCDKFNGNMSASFEEPAVTFKVTKFKKAQIHKQSVIEESDISLSESKYNNLKMSDDNEKIIAKTHKRKIEKHSSKKMLKAVFKISLITIGSFAVIFACFVGYDKLLFPTIQYNQAEHLLDKGRYDEAIEKYKGLKTYKNSEEHISEALYRQANDFLNKSQYDRAFENLEKILNYKDSQAIYNEEMYRYALELYNNGKFTECANHFNKIKNYKDCTAYLTKPEIYWRTKGNIVKFGCYEQDGIKSNGSEPIEWIVINPDFSENAVLLVSKMCLDYKKYDTGNYGLDNEGNYDETIDGGVSWIDCSLRLWLNTSFFNNAFTKKERTKLKPINLTYSISADGGEWITDNVSILSKDEAKKYFDEDIQMSTGATKYAFEMNPRFKLGFGIKYEYSEKEIVDYWLRSIDKKATQDVVVSTMNIGGLSIDEDKGEVQENAALYFSHIIAVRPIIAVLIS